MLAVEAKLVETFFYSQLDFANIHFMVVKRTRGENLTVAFTFRHPITSIANAVMSEVFSNQLKFVIKIDD